MIQGTQPAHALPSDEDVKTKISTPTSTPNKPTFRTDWKTLIASAHEIPHFTFSLSLGVFSGIAVGLANKQLRHRACPSIYIQQTWEYFDLN